MLEHVNQHRIIADLVATNRRLHRLQSSFRLEVAAKLGSGWLSEISGYIRYLTIIPLGKLILYGF